MVKVRIDFSVFEGPNSGAWGMVNGEIDLPNIPAVGDNVWIAPDSIALAALDFPAAIRVEGVINMRENWPDWDNPVDTILMLEDVVLTDDLAAGRVAWVLWRRLGLEATRWERRISQAWLAARGGLHDARIVAVEHGDQAVGLCLDDEWANDPEAERIGGPGDLIIVRPQVLEGDLAACEGGWIREVTLAGGNHVVVDFCDRERLMIAFAEVRWNSYGTPER